MTPFDAYAQHLTRRSFLGRTAAGLGSLALGSLLDPRLFAAAGADRWGGVVQPLHQSLSAIAQKVVTAN